MTFIDFFAGIGGFRRGLELAGHKCVGFCEYDKFATASYTSMHLITEKQREYLKTLTLKQRQKEILKDEYRNGEWYANDIRTVNAGNLPTADCWCFGAPCQDFSVAGKRAGMDGDRSSLVREVFRILEEQKEQDRPEWLIYENVKGMLSSNKGLDYLSILSEMDKLGYDIEWQSINSKWFVPQNRERIYTIGHLRRYGARKVLPVTGADGENSIQQIGNLYGTEKEPNPSGGRFYDTNEISCATGSGHGMSQPLIGSLCFVDMNYGAGIKETETCRTLQARYNKGICNHSGELSGVRILCNVKCININDKSGKERQQQDRVYDISGDMTALSANLGGRHNIAIPVLTPNRVEKRQNGRRFKKNGEPMFTLTAQDRHGVAIKIKEATKKGYTEAHESDSINFSVPGSKTWRGRVGKGVAQTLDTACNQGVFVKVSDKFNVYAIWYEKYQCYIAIRKLTPKECFRLQGWTDDYFEKAAFVNSDNQLYKQAGNGVTVTVVKAIAEKMKDWKDS
nr:MAG: C-5 cytosine-specific DNA methylase [Bacteriophage sp.]